MHRRRFRNHLLLLNRRAESMATWDQAKALLGPELYSNGDRDIAIVGGWHLAMATRGLTTGVASFVLEVGANSYAGIGFSQFTTPGAFNYMGENGSLGWGALSHGYDATPGNVSSNGVTFGSGDKVLAILDRDNEEARFYKLVAGAWSIIGSAHDISAAAGVELFPAVTGISANVTGNWGQSAFPAAPPGGVGEGGW